MDRRAKLRRMLFYQIYPVGTRLNQNIKLIQTIQASKRIAKPLTIKVGRVSRPREPVLANPKCSSREESTS